MATASLVLGILTLVFRFIVGGWIPWITGILSIVLGFKALNSSDSELDQLSLAGIICSLIGLILPYILMLFLMLFT